MPVRFVRSLMPLLFVLAFAATRCIAAPSLFDPAKHMRVSEVRAGMTGYGTSVFKGTDLEKFDVQVVSVLKNFNPKDDVILIRCSGANLEHTGAIAGMSGSPIYLKDDSGKYRMIGAFAYGWPLVKDPIAGVQPIEYMLALPDHQKDSTTAPVRIKPSAAEPQMHWKLSDAIPLPGMKLPPASYPLASAQSLEPSANLSALHGDSERLQPLATPMMTGGLSPSLIAAFTPILRAYGLQPMQAGGSSSAPSTAPSDESITMKPGSVLAAPLLTGDTDMTAIGTCTEVVGNRIFGFGHPFNNEGSINLPFGAGEINGIVAELRQSFKLGSMTRTIGTLTTDQSVGISGHIGAVPPTLPIDLHVVYTDGSSDQHYHFDSVIHPKFTPLLGTMALAAALTGQRELPENHTIDYDLNIHFANGRTLDMKNMSADDNPAMLFLQFAGPMTAAADNPFAKVMPDRISGTVRVLPETRMADILSVNVAKQKYKPGETLTADVQYRPFRSSEATLPVDLQLPRDLPDGQYQLSVGGWERYVQDETMSRPFRFNADNIDQVFDVLNDFNSIRHDAVYLRLVRQADGVAVGRVAMPRLPSSVRQVMLDAGRSDTSAFVSSNVRIVPTKLILSGAADFTITIQTPGRSETAHQGRPEMPTPVMPPVPGAPRRAPQQPMMPK